MTRRFKPTALLLATVLLFVLAACGSDEADPQPNLIGPEGGEWTDHDVTVIIPAGALAKSVLVSIQPVDSPSPDGFIVIGPFVRLEPSQVELAKPVQVIVPLNEALLPAGRDSGEAQVITSSELIAAFDGLQSSPTDDGRVSASLDALGVVGAAIPEESL
jgi:hypothetical protein